jgi:hypothetical protein
MFGRREPAHVDPDFGDDDMSAEVLDARNRRYELDCAAALAHQIGKRRVQFDVGVLECLLDPQHMARLFANQLLTRAQ